MQTLDDLKSNPTLAEIIKSYSEQGAMEQDLQVDSDDEISTARVPFDCVEGFPGGTAGTTKTMAHLVIRAGTVIKWFNYGNAGQYPDGLGSKSTGKVDANEVDTSLEKASVLSSGEERAILGIAMTRCDKFIKWDLTNAATINAEVAPTDPDVLAAYNGQVAMGDPGALMSPDVTDSPFLLEDYLFEKFKEHARIYFKFDRTEPKLVGDCDQIPGAAATSYLRASGSPDVDNFYKLPNGYRWAREGHAGHELTVICEVKKPIVIPVALVALWNKAAGVNGFPMPSAVALAVRMRLIGPRIGFRSNN